MSNEYTIYKQDGFKHYRDQKGFRNSSHKNSRSVHWYNKANKLRGLRRKADRHSHHRRRQIAREELIKTEKTGKEPELPPSYTCVQKRRPGSGGYYSSTSQLCSNRGPRGSLKTMPDEMKYVSGSYGHGHRKY